MKLDCLLEERQREHKPVRVAEGCRLARDVPRDTTLTYDDVILPPGRLVDKLLDAQSKLPVGRPPGLVATECYR